MPPKKYYKPKSTYTPVSVSETKKFLVIVESPSKCKKIEEYLGSDYQCIASCGHFRAIAGLSSIDVKNDYAINFTIDPSKQDIVDNMRRIIGLYSPERIYLASDDDREGEAIAWHICDTFGLEPATTHRITFHEITKPALIEAVRNPRTINMNLVHAQFARQVLDMLVGFRISPVLWRHIFSNKKNALSAGRCQTPALRLVLENEMKREKEAESSVFYRVKGKFTARDVEFILDHEFSDVTSPDCQGGQSLTQTLSFLEETKTFRHFLQPLPKSKDSIRQPPKPFTTSRLLQTSRWSPKQTMEMAQQLYQQGLITYMRTDAETYSPVFLESARTFILNQWKNDKYLSRELTEVALHVSQDGADYEREGVAGAHAAHEAIRCTNINMSYITTENASVNALYRMIWLNTVESCMSAAHYKTTKVSISSPIPNVFYHTTIEVPVFLGWKIVGMKTDNLGDGDLGNKEASFLHYLQTLLGGNQPITWSEIQTSAHMRDRIGHYTESSLIKKLEDLGIGRPSTFASIVETLKDRGYVAKQDVVGKEVKCSEYLLESDGKLTLISNKRTFGNETAKLVLQPLGRLAAEFLTEHFGSEGEVFDYDYTSLMESRLDKISSGEEAEWSNVCKDCSRDLRALLKELEGVEKKVYPLGDATGYEFVFTSSGQTMRKKSEDGDGWEYVSVRKDLAIDLNKLERKEYTFEDLVEIPNEVLGEYLGETVYLKSGKFGLYVEHGDNTVSLNTLSHNSARNIRLCDVIHLLENKIQRDQSDNDAASNPNILRVITQDMSVRKGKYGTYIYYKTGKMKSPKFFPTKGFKQNVMTCDLSLLESWVSETHLS